MVKKIMSLLLLCSFGAYASENDASYLETLLSAKSKESEQSLDKTEKEPQIARKKSKKSTNDDLRSASASSNKKKRTKSATDTETKPKNDILVQFLKEQRDGWDWMEKGCAYITPSSFNAVGKAILTKYIAVWVDAAKEGNIPTDSGLAKEFFNMQQDGVEKVINDLPSLQKANEYYAEYQKSPSVELESIVKKMDHGSHGDYYFPGATEAIEDRLRITRQIEYYNMLYKRHEAPIMPEKNLVEGCLSQGSASAQILLKLNQDNTKLVRSAIRGITLLDVYYLQEDQKSDQQHS